MKKLTQEQVREQYPTLDLLANALENGELGDQDQIDDLCPGREPKFLTDVTELPVYGGPDVSDTNGIFSWDASRVLVPRSGWVLRARKQGE